MREWFASTTDDARESLAESLGVQAITLSLLRCSWSPTHQAWAFAMRDGSGRICGIRLRWENGHKKSVTGSREGIFLPMQEPSSEAWIPEGPTDTAALLTLGKFAIGRPSCSGGIAHIAATVARLNIRRAIIIADNDTDKMRPNWERWNPGLDGAQRLADEIGVPCCILILPCKDAREYLAYGGTAELLDSLVSGIVWHQPNKSRSITHATNLVQSVQYSTETCQA